MVSTTCPHCGATVPTPDSSRFCVRCGEPLISAQANPPRDTIGPTKKLFIQDGANVLEIDLEDKPTLTLGSASDSQIILTSSYVSLKQATLFPEGEDYRIESAPEMRYPLFYQGQPISKLSLKDGHQITIGDPTSSDGVTLIYRNSLRPEFPPTDWPGKSFDINPQAVEISIGRAAGCNLQLPNPQVSKLHALIRRTDDGRHNLRDLGSANGTFVNGQRIGQQAGPLKLDDVIHIGPYRLIYKYSKLDFFDARGLLHLEARGLTCRVRKGNRQVTILQDTTLTIKPCEFVALVGGSGAGKSTLLGALSGYKRATDGKMLVNGDDFYAHFDTYRTLLGYVPQDDIIHRTLTITQALNYAARLRLPPETSAEELEARVNAVLDAVEMQEHRDTFIHRLSGGQRKRVSIAVELLADPGLFFLDEPTSGLDPGLDKKMMLLLRQLANRGRTVVLVTHATSNIQACDLVVFMAEGRLVFCGPPDEALRFFNVPGGDFADIYLKLGVDNYWEVVQHDLLNVFNTMRETGAAGHPPVSLAMLWERKFRASPYYQRYIVERQQQVPQQALTGSAGQQAERPGMRISTLRQFAILFSRNLCLLRQDWQRLLFLLLQAPLIALLLTLVVRNDALTGVPLSYNPNQRVEAQTLLFMVATVSVWFGIINAAQEITKEVPIVRRERLVNLHLLPYLGAKMALLSLLALVQNLLLMLVLAWKVSYPTAGLLLPLPLELYLTLTLTALAGTGLGLAISAWSKNADQAMSLVPLVLVPQILFAGMIFRIEGLAEPLSWMTISRWALDGAGASANLNALKTLCLNPTGVGLIPCATTAAAYAHEPAHLLGRWGVLILYTLVCLALTAWPLRRVG